MTRKATVAFVTLTMVQILGNRGMSQPKCDLLKVAQEYVFKHYPSFDSTGLKVIVSETDDLWEMTYELPPGTLGGTPAITIDKRTCTVVRAQHSQ